MKDIPVVLQALLLGHWRMENETGVEEKCGGKRNCCAAEQPPGTCACDRMIGESKTVQVTLSEQGGVVSEPWYL